jgi:hypothetical protein
MKFSYLPGLQIDQTNFQQACDLSVSSSCDNNLAHPEWVNTIKIQALNAYKAAFAKPPAIVSHKQTVTMQYGGQNLPRFEHIVYVDGDWSEFPGLTQRRDFSWVFYPQEINIAESLLGPYGQLRQFTPPLGDTTNMRKLATAVGKGIGKTAAHETAHQINFSVILPGIECGPGAPANMQKDCQKGVNSVYEAASAGLWDFIDYSPPIDWELVDIPGLQQYFKCTPKDCQ